MPGKQSTLIAHETPVVPEMDMHPTETQALYQRLDPIVCQVLSEFSDSHGCPSHELARLHVGAEPHAAWELTTNVADVCTGDVRVEVGAGAAGQPKLTLHHSGVGEEGLAQLHRTLTERTGLEVVAQHTPDIRSLPR